MGQTQGPEPSNARHNSGVLVVRTKITEVLYEDRKYNDETANLLQPIGHIAARGTDDAGTGRGCPTGSLRLCLEGTGGDHNRPRSVRFRYSGGQRPPHHANRRLLHQRRDNVLS